MKNVIDVLEERGFIEAMTSQELRENANKPLKVYCGFDPTGESLHLGSMVPMMGLKWFQKYGHTIYAIVGGATGIIGDPSGKTSERQLLDEATIERNLIGIKKNLELFLDFSDESKARLLNNYDWFKNYSFIHFLRDIGKYFRVGTMLAKESVKTRLNSEDGMSFTEFSYQILQGYDFLHLNQNYGVNVQMGGSDQWGNITAGTDLIRKVSGGQAYGLTFPLLTRSDGQKFGKSEKGAIWLSSEKLSPYEFYQYLYRVSDADVIKLMKLLTFMEMDEIREFERSLDEKQFIPNQAQKRLAEEVTRNVHGEEGLQAALKATAGASPGQKTKLDASFLENAAVDMPNEIIPKNEILNAKLIDIIVQTDLQQSKSEARRLIRNGGFYLNNEKISDENYIVTEANLIGDNMLLLAAGKKNKKLIRLKE